MGVPIEAKLLGVGFLLLVLGPLVYRYLSSSPHPENKWLANEGAPRLLCNSKLVMVEPEQDIFCDTPIQLHGRPDTVFRCSNGELVVMDTKTRESNRVFDTDILQLSVYGYIMEKGYGQKVHRYGYVRTIIGRYQPKVSYHKVHLLSAGVIEHLYGEYRAIESGEFKPECVCGNCEPVNKPKKRRSARFGLSSSGAHRGA